MNCYLIRDLLPLYIEGDCSPETNRAVQEHLNRCKECKSDYELMAPPLNVKELVENGMASDNTSQDSNDFWRKYYGKMILKGIGLFILVYVLVVSISFI